MAKLQNREIKCLYSCEKFFLGRELGSCLILYIYMYLCTLDPVLFGIYCLSSYVHFMCSVTDHFVMHVLPVVFFIAVNQVTSWCLKFENNSINLHSITIKSCKQTNSFFTLLIEVRHKFILYKCKDHSVDHFLPGPMIM